MRRRLADGDDAGGVGRALAVDADVELVGNVVAEGLAQQLEDDALLRRSERRDHLRQRVAHRCHTHEEGAGNRALALNLGDPRCRRSVGEAPSLRQRLAEGERRMRDRSAGSVVSTSCSW